MSVRVCYNEIDPWCCNRMRDRIADGGLPYGQVIEKDIRLLTPKEVAGYDQCHFFAGIGGAGLACRWAGFDRPIWTGGFPCQDISLAGTGHGVSGRVAGSDRTHRLKALGNAWVPQVAAAILRAWMKWE